MYKLQKIRSRKIIHDFSIGYRQKLTRTVLSSRKEIINTAQMPLKFQVDYFIYLGGLN